MTQKKSTVELLSTITCPYCGEKSTEQMADSCRYLGECQNVVKFLKL